MPKVKEIDHKAIFEKAAGHPAKSETRVIVCGEKPIPEINNGRTLSGILKPMSFTITPRRREQFFV